MPHLQWITEKVRLPTSKGSYLLWIELKQTALSPPKYKENFDTGIFLYAGSAKGPGGLKARCGRHLTQDKSLKWHVDWLTRAATDIYVLPFADQTECQIMRALKTIPGGHIPFEKFGSSDCNTCEAHLVMCPEGYDRQLLERHVLKRFNRK